MRARLQPGIAVVLIALAGCSTSTINSRIRKRQAVFNSPPPAVQAEIRRGRVGIGFTPDMVCLAFGQPDEIRQRADPADRETVWKYNSCFDRDEGTVRAGHRRCVTWDPRLHAHRSYDEPVDANLYRPVRETLLRVTFRDGKVTAIDQMTS